MALAPIVTIPVDDSEFEKFKAAFADYHAKLKTMPAEWQAVNQRIMELAKVQRQLGASSDRAWSNATTAAMQYERAIQGAAKAQEHLDRQTHGARTALHKMAEEAKAISMHLGSAFRSFARFGAYSIGGGLAGLGGLAFGLDRLSDSVLAKSRQARSLGLSVGALNSFDIHLARVAGPNVLANAAQAQLEPQQAGNLATLGIPWQRAVHESATKLAGQELLAIHRAFVRNPAMFGLTAQARAGQALGFSMLEMQNIGRTPQTTLERDLQLAAKDKSALGFSDQVAREWSNLSIQLHKAGTEIETELVKALGGIAGPLGNLSSSIVTLISDLGKSPEIKQWIDDLSVGIQNFAGWLDSPQFRADMHTFAKDFAAVARVVARVAGDVGAIPEIVHGASPSAAAAGHARFEHDKTIPGTTAYQEVHQGGSPGWVFDKKYGGYHWIGPMPPGLNNPLNMKDTSGKFMSFWSQGAGLRAADRRLLTAPAYQNETLAQQIATWNGHGKNTPEYQRRVARWAGQTLGLGHPLSLDMPFAEYSPNAQAAVLAAMSREEGHAISDKRVVQALSVQTGSPEVARAAARGPAFSAPAPQLPVAFAVPPDARARARASDADQIRAQARALYEREFGRPAPSTSRALQTAALPPAPWQPSDISSVRSRFWQTHKTTNVKIQNNAASRVHVETNAAAGP